MIPIELKDKFMEMSKKIGLPEELIEKISEALNEPEMDREPEMEEGEASVTVVAVEEEGDDIDNMSEEEAKEALRKIKGNKKSAKEKLLEERKKSY